MGQKKSMRNFWLSFFLLLLIGTALIAAAQYKLQKSGTQKIAAGHQDTEGDVGREQTSTLPGTGTQHAGLDIGIPKTPYTDQGGHASSAQAKPTDGAAVGYRFELRAVNGYLDVYHYGTGQLFLHTGIPCSVLTAAQCQELNDGKYFLNEQELYGYLESCTS